MKTNAAITKVGFFRGPLGWAVTNDGHPVGRISKTPRGYLVSIDGFRPGINPQTRGQHVFPTFAAAKGKCRQVLEN